MSLRFRGGRMVPKHIPTLHSVLHSLSDLHPWLDAAWKLIRAYFFHGHPRDRYAARECLPKGLQRACHHPSRASTQAGRDSRPKVSQPTRRRETDSLQGSVEAIDLGLLAQRRLANSLPGNGRRCFR